MAASKKKAKPLPVRDPEKLRRWRKVLSHVTAVIVLLSLLAVGYAHLKKYVLREVAFPDRPPNVVLKDRPAWMSDALAMQIINSVRPAGAHSAFDRQLLADTAAILARNPWVKTVTQIRRAYTQSPADTLEIDCVYRAPIALVHWEDYYWLVDGESVKLPEQFTRDQLSRIMFGADHQLNLRVIEGVAQPPMESGQVWKGDDLAAGLDLVKLLYGKPYANEIEKVDVRNFGGRIDSTEAQLSLITRYETSIRWGLPIRAADFFAEVPAAAKLASLETVYNQFHRVDGNQPWIDIRFDRITYPSGQASVPQER